MRWSAILWMGSLCVSWASAAEPVQKLERYEYESKHMGTLFRIVLYASNRATADLAAREAFARVAELDGIMSDYKPNSELMQLCKKNAVKAGEPVVVSRDLFTVLAYAKEVSELSDGAFDVTVGPLVQLWRMSRRTQQLPDRKELESAKARVGFRKMELDAQQRTVRLLVPGMQLDLGGIAKGYAADEALLVLRKHGITRALVAAGGDIAVADAPPDQPGWRVEIASLSKNQPRRIVLLKNAAVSTSGDVEQFVEINGVRYSHILDPRTGLGLIGRRSVSVIAPKGIQSDSFTKAASLLPVERVLELIEKSPGMATLIVTRTEKGETVIASKRFSQFLAPQD